jgi:Tol biopolymer transport system component
MDRERWQQIDRLLSSALQLEPDERQAFLETACAGDEELRREVEDLLHAHDQAGNMLERPALGMPGLDRIPGEKSDALIGTQLGFYQVEALIGTGGMGRVYRARDTRLPRHVALKVLPEEYGSDMERVRRFKREAQAASALNHPNILTVYDIGDSEGKLYLATEYIEGQTLRQRLAEGHLTVKEALDLGIQIAGALAVAHRAGIVHRDIKPENVMIRPDGLAKVLDFGLARVTERETGTAETSTTAMTRPGIIMGTAGYMSPEQVQGAKLDGRSDIFNFGAVLYEMLTGRRAFQRDSTTQTLAAIMDEEPKAIGELIPDSPPDLDRIVRRCLCKDREHRFQHMDDVRVELAEVTEELKSGARKAAAARGKLWWAGVLAGVSVLTVALGVAVWFWGIRSGPTPAASPTITVPLTSYSGFESFPSFSPDGNQVAFAWPGEDRRNMDIYVKMIGGQNALRLTNNPAIETSPVWSPDGRLIAFLRHRPPGASIFTVSALGGQERKLIDLKGSLLWDSGLAWSPDGKSLAVSARTSEQSPFRLLGVSLETLEAAPLTAPPDGSWGDVWPSFSPDGHMLAFARCPKPFRADLWIQHLDTGMAERITSENFTNIIGTAWAGGGQEIVFAGARGRVTRLWRIPVSGGTPAQLPGVGENAILPVVSHQGNRLVFVQRSAWQGDIWRLARLGPSEPVGPPTPIITSTRLDWNAHFSADGKRIAFQSDRSGQFNIWMCESDGSNPIQLTELEGETGTPRWSPDGKWIAFDSRPGDNSEIYVIRAEGGVPRRLTNHQADDVVPGWSRDSNWVYFASDRSGEYQVWKVPAEGGEAKQVTRGGGFNAVESLDGVFLYYSRWGGVSNAAGDGIWEVPVQGGRETRILDREIIWPNWDLAADGIYFLTQSGPGEWPIERLDLETGKITPVFIHRDPRRHYSLAVSPDGHFILFGIRPWPEADLMLVENFR